MTDECRDCGGSGYATTYDGKDLGTCWTCNGDGGQAAFDAVDGYVAELEDATGSWKSSKRITPRPG